MWSPPQFARSLTYGYVFIRHFDKLFSFNEVVYAPPSGEKRWERSVAAGGGQIVSSPAVFDACLFISGAPVGAKIYHDWALEGP